MAERNKDLTISLLSSGRIDSIERCLSSLAPFKEQLNTEIIVIDTDPEHRQDVNVILNKYADHVVPFQWCNDFSAARNVGMKMSHSEWFMYVDDDEWFIDAQPIIDFIHSPESNNYQLIEYMLRNFLDPAQIQYTDSWVARVFRLEKGMCFTGTIHEYVTPIRNKSKAVHAIANHTGYAYHSMEEKYAHAKRNMDALEVMIKKEPNEVRWLFQMIMEYRNINDRDKELAYCYKAFDLMNEAMGYKNSCIRGVFAADILRILNEQEKWKECDKAYRKILSKKKPIGKVARARMEIDAAQAALNLQMTANSRKHAKAYLNSYKKYHDMPVQYTEDYLFFLIDTYSDEEVARAKTMLIRLDLLDGRWDSFDEYFDWFQWDGSAEYPIEECERAIVDAASKVEYDERFSKLAGVLWSNLNSRNILQKDLYERTETNDETRWNIIRAVLEADTIEKKPLDLKIVWDDHVGLREYMPIYYNKLFTATNPLLLDELLWRIGMRRGASLDKRIGEIPIEQWEQYVVEFISSSNLSKIDHMAKILEDVYLGSVDKHYAFFMKQIDTIHKMTMRSRQQESDETRNQEKLANQTEMKQIIETLESKVDDLVGAGKLDEANMVLQEIEKYTKMLP